LFNFDGCASNSIKNWVATTEKWGGTKKNFSTLCAEIITTTIVPLHFQNLSGAYGLLLVRIALTARWIATLLLLVLLVGYYY